MTHGEETESFIGHARDPLDGDDYNECDPYCYECDDTGLVMTCCDDMCRGAGECIHGDGMKICPHCKGRNAY